MLKFVNFSIKFFIIFSLVCLFFAFSTLWYFSIGLPDYKKLSNYQPPISSRVYSNDGKLIAEYALEKRLFIPFDSVPKKVNFDLEKKYKDKVAETKKYDKIRSEKFDETWAINSVSSVIYHDKMFMMDPPSRFLDTPNAGKQTAKGLEFDLLYRPMENIDFTLSGTFLDPVYDEFVGSAAGDISGRDVEGVHKESVATSVTWNWESGS